jgi:hypothetical protein
VGSSTSGGAIPFALPVWVTLCGRSAVSITPAREGSLCRATCKSGRFAPASLASLPGRVVPVPGRGVPVATRRCCFGRVRRWLGRRPTHNLVENVILPAASDSEIGRRDAEPYETITLKDTLRSDVLVQRPGLDSMQTKPSERHVDDFSNRSRAKTAAVVRRVHPVAEVARLERAPHDVAERHATDDAVVVEDHVRGRHATLVVEQPILDGPALAIGCEEPIRSDRLPRREKPSVDREQIGKDWCVFDRYETDNRHHTDNRIGPMSRQPLCRTRRLSPKRLLITRYARAGKRTTLSLRRRTEQLDET